jgi:hypothetical protein
MGPFDFVCAFYSVVLGVAVAQLMTDIGRLLEIRNQVRTYWVHSLWVVTVLFASLGNWWGMWSARSLKIWTFCMFALVVAFAAAIYLMTVLLFPRLPESQQGIDLRRYFYKNRRIFFSVTAIFWALGIVCNVTLFPIEIFDLWIVIPGLLMLASVVGIFTANPRYHAAFALAAALLNISLIFVAGGAPIDDQGAVISPPKTSAVPTPGDRPEQLSGD